jgi:hypothetical protein
MATPGRQRTSSRAPTPVRPSEHAGGSYFDLHERPRSSDGVKSPGPNASSGYLAHPNERVFPIASVMSNASDGWQGTSGPTSPPAPSPATGSLPHVSPILSTSSGHRHPNWDPTISYFSQHRHLSSSGSVSPKSQHGMSSPHSTAAESSITPRSSARVPSRPPSAARSGYNDDPAYVVPDDEAIIARAVAAREAFNRSPPHKLEPLFTARFEHQETPEGHMIVTGREGEILRCEDEVGACRSGPGRLES